MLGPLGVPSISHGRSNTNNIPFSGGRKGVHQIYALPGEGMHIDGYISAMHVDVA